jgi:hypothetical protein
LSRKLTIEEVKNRLYEIHGDTVTLDETTYVNTLTKCRFVDKEYGEWWVLPYKILNRYDGHPARKQEKKRQTCLVKYGCEHPLQNKDIKEKIKQTNLEKYGCEHPLQNKNIQEKYKQTCLDKYGHECPLYSKYIQEKRKKTCLEKYGCEYASQNAYMAQKAARSQATSTVLKHWKTNEDVVCQAGWEPKVVQYFNDNKIDFIWQICFDMPNGKKYFVDAYLPEQDLYVEIKGYMREKNKLKFDWFCSQHSNTELWDKKKLKELNIL